MPDTTRTREQSLTAHARRDPARRDQRTCSRCSTSMHARNSLTPMRCPLPPATMRNTLSAYSSLEREGGNGSACAPTRSPAARGGTHGRYRERTGSMARNSGSSIVPDSSVSNSWNTSSMVAADTTFCTRSCALREEAAGSLSGCKPRESLTGAKGRPHLCLSCRSKCRVHAAIVRRLA